jgi:uncharacterized surface protein with fasciclin (FAS1) repeats
MNTSLIKNIIRTILVFSLSQIYQLKAQNREIIKISPIVEAKNISSLPSFKQNESINLDRIVRAFRKFDTEKMKNGYTLFIPNNYSFLKMETEVQEYYSDTSNYKELHELIKYHVIDEKLTKKDIIRKINKSGGKFLAKTQSGYWLKFTMHENKKDIVIYNEFNKKTEITSYNWKSKNGILHIVNSVICPFDYSTMCPQVGTTKNN